MADMRYKGQSGKMYSVVQPPIGQGGEGTVYEIVGEPSFVLKIYGNGKATETRRRKLEAMLAVKLPPAAMKQVTWPVDIVTCNGRFAGYVMPKVAGGEDLNVIYSNKYKSTLSERITIAKNLCAAIDAIHDSGQVCGDLNPRNIKVYPKTKQVILIDTDSYHISDSTGKIYKCEVGLAEYLPVEIQNKVTGGLTFASAPLPTYTKETDLFALAVHIFALLMNGTHPFACASLASSKSSNTAPNQIQNICTGYFPFYEKKTGITLPVYAPEFNILPKYMRDLFVDAFVKGHKEPKKRPDTVAWYHALEQMQSQLKTCSKDNYHMYPAHLHTCPWCELEEGIKKARANMTAILNKNYKQRNNQMAGGSSNPAIGSTYTPVTIGNTNYTKPVNSAGNQNKKSQNTTVASWVQTKPTPPPQQKKKKWDMDTWYFWLKTLGLVLAVQLSVMGLFGDSIVELVFGNGAENSIDRFLIHIAYILGPWGFAASAVAGMAVYNKYYCKRKQNGKYEWDQYLYSLLASLAFCAGYAIAVHVIMFIFNVAFGFMIVLGVLAMFAGGE